MQKMIAATVLWGVAAFAGAAPIKLDFEGLANGAFVQDYFKGGTDSNGNVGFDYGISLPGAYVIRDANGSYLKAFWMEFDPSIAYMWPGDDMTAISFLYLPTFDFGAPPGSNLNIPVRMTNLGSDYANIVVPEPGFFAAGTIQGPSIFGIDFEGLLLDDIQFGIRVEEDLTARPFVSGVPEPSPIVLIGAGLAALIWVRRRKDTREQL